MDEPFGALDPGTREAVQDEFLRLHGRLRKTVVVVTHDIGEAGKLADGIVLMDHGRIVQSGSLRDLLVRPADARVRAFLGGHGQRLSLESLRLEHVLDDVPVAPAAADALRLSPALRLGQVLVALANASADATVVVGDGPERAYRALALRDAILRDVRQADGANGE
jgi:osmoprotectant transport system ATP-binding protein